uniref:Uncharacterized protein n=1 Tax=viral metagenome TaxID=1070528 RepID=A0A6C0BT13_9ZZZZ
MDLNFEEEQLQKILLKESENLKIKMDRELIESQKLEYEMSLKKDLGKLDDLSLENKDNKGFDEPSVEEMRRVRLIRFGGYQLVKD